MDSQGRVFGCGLRPSLTETVRLEVPGASLKV